MGTQTKVACETVRKTTMRVVTVYQIILMFAMKTHPWILMLWAMPVVAGILLYLQVRVFPPITYTFLDSQVVLCVCMLIWFGLFRCAITPFCGEGSRYFVNAPWDHVVPIDLASAAPSLLSSPLSSPPAPVPSPLFAPPSVVPLISVPISAPPQ